MLRIKLFFSLSFIFVSLSTYADCQDIVSKSSNFNWHYSFLESLAESKLSSCKSIADLKFVELKEEEKHKVCTALKYKPKACFNTAAGGFGSKADEIIFCDSIENRHWICKEQESKISKLKDEEKNKVCTALKYKPKACFNTAAGGFGSKADEIIFCDSIENRHLSCKEQESKISKLKEEEKHKVCTALKYKPKACFNTAAGGFGSKADEIIFCDSIENRHWICKEQESKISKLKDEEKNKVCTALKYKPKACFNTAAGGFGSKADEIIFCDSIENRHLSCKEQESKISKLKDEEKNKVCTALKYKPKACFNTAAGGFGSKADEIIFCDSIENRHWICKEQESKISKLKDEEKNKVCTALKYKPKACFNTAAGGFGSKADEIIFCDSIENRHLSCCHFK